MRRRRPTLPLDARLRQNPEQRRPSDLWQSYDARLIAAIGLLRWRYSRKKALRLRQVSGQVAPSL